MQTIQEAHQQLCDVFEKPEDAAIVFVMNKNGVYPCECWTDVCHTMFFLLRLRNSVESEVRQNGEQSVDSALYWKGIALSDIQFVRQGGNVFNSTSQVSKGNGRYIGVSVGGIGFGEFNYKPPVYQIETHDSRTIDLYFTDKDGEAERIPFTYGSLDNLMRVIPEKFK